MIEIKDVSVVYKSPMESYKVLSHLNLSVPTGGTCALIGPSGCGKSTLLKVVAGILTDYSGKVEINGEALSPFRQKIGFIGQNYGLLPWKNVYANIGLGVKVKERRNCGREVVEAMMQQLGLSGLGGRYPTELSGGQQQRVSLARAFLLKPDILLMDEPFSALDAITREEIQDVFLSVWQKNSVSTILVTHYVEEAVYLGQKIVLLSARRGGIARVIDNPLFGRPDIRQAKDFFALSLELKRLIKEEWGAC